VNGELRARSFLADLRTEIDEQFDRRLSGFGKVFRLEHRSHAYVDREEIISRRHADKLIRPGNASNQV
jgi:hypothetical protein